MFLNIVKILSISTVLLFIVGCSKSTLDLTHNVNTKITTLDIGDDKKYQINDSKRLVNKSRAASFNRASSSKEIYNSQGICSSFMFVKLPPLGRNMYYNSFAKADVYKMHKGKTCNTEEIDGLEFHSCENKYAITYEDVSPDEGYLYEKRYLYMNSKKCFDDIKKTIKLKKVK